ncbi:MAG: SsrA-binding protein SmpB [Magnetococcus sp. WYHC-3]
MSIKIIADNRKARFNYEILDRLEAGVALTGTEVKSLRAGKLHMGDSYAVVQRGELWWLNANIAEYSHGSYTNHDPLRTRKLLLHAAELRRLIGLVQEKGMALIPLKAYWKGSHIKLEIGVCRGKKLHDKRATTQERDWQREKQRLLKQDY